MKAWSPRPSIAARLLFEADARQGLAKPASGRGFARAFPLAIAREGTGILASLGRELRRLRLPGLDTVGVTIDADDWRLGGSATLAHDGSPRLSLTIGFLLAVEEATLEFLANTDAFCPMSVFTAPGTDDDDRPITVQSFHFDTEGRRGRFRDYRTARQRPAPHLVTGGFPIERWRLRQQELLVTLVIRWAALHEIAHGALRHNELLTAIYSAEANGAGMVETSPVDDASANFDWATFGYAAAPDVELDVQPVRKVLELHADTAALWLALDLARQEAENGDGLFTAYERDMAALVGDAPHIFTTLAPDTRTHLILLAALIAIVLFEQARRATGMDEGHSHPIPEARLITLLRSSFYGCTFAQADGEGGFEIRMPQADLYGDVPTSPWNRFLQDAIARAVEDMTFFADVLDLDIQLFEDTAGPPPDTAIDYSPDGYPRPIHDLDASPTAGWWRDVLSWNRTSLAERAGETFEAAGVSAGGRELDALSAYQPHLNFLTEVFQHLHGQPLQFLLTVRA